MLKISVCSENCKKACWKYQNVLKTVKKHVENFRLFWNSNACCVFKISAHVENCNTCSKLCWIFQGVLKICWKFQGMLKTIICVENYVETACWKFQLTHVESYVKISRCVENVYVRHVKNHIENRVEVWKKHHHTLRHMLKLSGRFCFSPSVLLHFGSQTLVELHAK